MKVELHQNLIQYIDGVNRSFFKGEKSRQTIILYLAQFFEEQRKKAENSNVTRQHATTKKKNTKKNSIKRKLLPF